MVREDRDVTPFGSTVKVLMNIPFLNGFTNIKICVVKTEGSFFGGDLFQNLRLYVGSLTCSKVEYVV